MSSRSSKGGKLPSKTYRTKLNLLSPAQVRSSYLQPARKTRDVRGGERATAEDLIRGHFESPDHHLPSIHVPLEWNIRAITELDRKILLLKNSARPRPKSVSGSPEEKFPIADLGGETDIESHRRKDPKPPTTAPNRIVKSKPARKIIITSKSPKSSDAAPTSEVPQKSEQRLAEEKEAKLGSKPLEWSKRIGLAGRQASRLKAVAKRKALERATRPMPGRAEGLLDISNSIVEIVCSQLVADLAEVVNLARIHRAGVLRVSKLDVHGNEMIRDVTMLKESDVEASVSQNSKRSDVPWLTLNRIARATKAVEKAQVIVALDPVEASSPDPATRKSGALLEKTAASITNPETSFPRTIDRASSQGQEAEHPEKIFHRLIKILSCVPNHKPIDQLISIAFWCLSQGEKDAEGFSGPSPSQGLYEHSPENIGALLDQVIRSFMEYSTVVRENLFELGECTRDRGHVREKEMVRRKWTIASSMRNWYAETIVLFDIKAPTTDEKQNGQGQEDHRRPDDSVDITALAPVSRAHSRRVLNTQKSGISVISRGDTVRTTATSNTTRTAHLPHAPPVHKVHTPASAGPIRRIGDEHGQGTAASHRVGRTLVPAELRGSERKSDTKDVTRPPSVGLIPSSGAGLISGSVEVEVAKRIATSGGGPVVSTFHERKFEVKVEVHRGMLLFYHTMGWNRYSRVGLITRTRTSSARSPLSDILKEIGKIAARSPNLLISGLLMEDMCENPPPAALSGSLNIKYAFVDPAAAAKKRRSGPHDEGDIASAYSGAAAVASVKERVQRRPNSRGGERKRDSGRNFVQPMAAWEALEDSDEDDGGSPLGWGRGGDVGSGPNSPSDKTSKRPGSAKRHTKLRDKSVHAGSDEDSEVQSSDARHRSIKDKKDSIAKGRGAVSPFSADSHSQAGDAFASSFVEKDRDFHLLAPRMNSDQLLMIMCAILSDTARSLLLGISVLVKHAWSGKDVSFEDVILIFGMPCARLIGRALLTEFHVWLKVNTRTDLSFKMANQTHVDLALQHVFAFWPEIVVSVVGASAYEHEKVPLGDGAASLMPSSSFSSPPPTARIPRASVNAEVEDAAGGIRSSNSDGEYEDDENDEDKQLKERLAAHAGGSAVGGQVHPVSSLTAPESPSAIHHTVQPSYGERAAGEDDAVVVGPTTKCSVRLVWPSRLDTQKIFTGPHAFRPNLNAI